MKPPIRHLRKRSGFTLVELLVVVAIIVALLAVLMPSLGRAIEVAERAKCASNLHQLHIGAMGYGTDNYGTLFKCRLSGNVRVPIAINPVEHNGSIDWFRQLADLGLATEDADAPGGYLFSEIWTCPSRGYTTTWENQYTQMVIGYQYLGGLDKWKNPFLGTKDGASPITIGSAKPGWTLVADASAKIDNGWGGGRGTAYEGMPPHTDGNNPWPAGQNQVSVDGAVEWVDGDELFFYHSWVNGFSRVLLMAQTDRNGWEPPAGAFLEALK